MFRHVLTWAEVSLTESEEQLAQLRRAIAHLDDPAFLESHPLTEQIGFIAQAPQMSRGQLLRRTLRLAIEALDPGTESPPNSPDNRPYEVLQRYAIAKQSMTSIASKLDISERHAYRALHQALEALTQILQGLAADPSSSVNALEDKTLTRAARVREEIERLAQGSNQDVDICELVSAAVENARHLAEGSNLQISLHLEELCLNVVVNRVMLRQAILNLLSYMVRAEAGNTISVQVQRLHKLALVRFRHQPGPLDDLPQSGSPYAIALQLLDSLGIQCVSRQGEDDVTETLLTVPLASEHTVLIVDDNEGTIALFTRYLRRRSYRVVGVTSGARVLEAVNEAHPDVIILDVMMPDRDGWEILEEIRASEAGARTRIIVCSVINDPQLASALGADGFMHKPVSQASLLQALESSLSRET